MKISFCEIENILKTLPIGYYIKRNVPVSLINEGYSYYDPSNDTICISYPTIAKALDKIEDANVEQVVRSLMYHEVSHAFLTPKQMEMDKTLNIFEDERIEQLCKSFYKDVDFTKLLMLINEWDGKTCEPPKTADDAWYQVVRYHIGKQEFVTRVYEIIMDHAKIHRHSDIIWYYRDAVYNLYEEVCKDFYQNQIKQQIEERESQMDGKPDVENEIQNAPLQQDRKLIQKCNDYIDTTYGVNVGETFEQSQIFFDANTQEKLRQIILEHKKVNASNSTAINAYSGVFDPRSVVRSDYKWFAQQNRMGNVKQFSKIKLNLFIDTSGSFDDNEVPVNQIILALKKIEQLDPKFEFDVIGMNTRFRILPKDKRTIRCSGANDIPDDAGEILRQTQSKNALNYNIVLFDGFAFSNCASKESRYKNIGVFNIPNTVMILEYSNRSIAERYCINTYRLYANGSYDKVLLQQICIALNHLFK